MNILVPVLMLSGLGVAFGIGLALAAKKFCVITDPRLQEVLSRLPGANCGVCGMAGCMGFAEGLIKGTCSIERCVVMKKKARDEIAGILGVQEKERPETVAVLHCYGGSKRVKDKFIYTGIKNCIAANLLMGGPKACIYGCIGFGTCLSVCPFGAIRMSEDNLPVVDENKCRACGKCVEVCPKGLFSLVASEKKYAVRCKSLDLGKEVMKVCPVGCIACRKCEKSCPVGAIKVIDNLSVIDYNICDNRGECFKVCPTKTIARKEAALCKSRD